MCLLFWAPNEIEGIFLSRWQDVYKRQEYSAANGVLIAEVEHLAEMEDLTLENLL